MPKGDIPFNCDWNVLSFAFAGVGSVDTSSAQIDGTSKDIPNGLFHINGDPSSLIGQSRHHGQVNLLDFVLWLQICFFVESNKRECSGRKCQTTVFPWIVPSLESFFSLHKKLFECFEL